MCVIYAIKCQINVVKMYYTCFLWFSYDLILYLLYICVIIINIRITLGIFVEILFILTLIPDRCVRKILNYIQKQLKFTYLRDILCFSWGQRLTPKYFSIRNNHIMTFCI